MIEDRLWSLANVVTGFSVAQSVALLYALGKDLEEVQHSPARVKKWVAAPTGAFSLLYVGAVWDIFHLVPITDAGDWTIWLHVTIGRSIAILSFGAFALAAVFAPEIEARLGASEREGPGSKP